MCIGVLTADEVAAPAFIGTHVFAKLETPAECPLLSGLATVVFMLSVASHAGDLAPFP